MKKLILLTLVSLLSFAADKKKDEKKPATWQYKYHMYEPQDSAPKEKSPMREREKEISPTPARSRSACSMLLKVMQGFCCPWNRWQYNYQMYEPKNEQQLAKLRHRMMVSRRNF